MDVLTLARAKAYAQALVETLGGEVEDIDESLKDLAGDADIINLDGDLASTLILNALRQHVWKNEDDAPICEAGSVTLNNTLKFPFNESQQTVALAKTQANTNYAVIPIVTSASGNAGEVVVSDKQVNGFKIATTGSAKTAVVNYIVIGGIV